MVAIRKIARKKMRKIYNYILIACFVLSATTCNAQQQKKEEGTKRDSAKSWGHTYVPPSSGNVFEKDEVLRSCPDHPWVKPRTYGPDEVRDVAEKMPHPHGGFSELFKYLRSCINYPPPAKKENIEGRVILTFIVEKDGSLTDIRVAKSVHPLLDDEAVRVVSEMPNWDPGEEDGNPVRVKFTLPITFRLDDKKVN